MMIRWPGHIQPGQRKDQLFAALDWLPTLVEIAGGPKGDELKKQIEAGQYPGIVNDQLDGADQIDSSDRQVRQVGSGFLLLLRRATPAAVRYKNWKMYYNIPLKAGQ